VEALSGRRATAHEGCHRDLGSLDPDTQADIAVIDRDRPHLAPAPDPVAALVYGLQGNEVETVLCAGDIVGRAHVE
jgi:atrazine chlorohydrolase/5-methylthioadenosine/S-adenosylhomocysteine deaminase